ncbi:MAG: head maturation protease, ClpP-related [Verrucomicrobiota bacterium]
MNPKKKTKTKTNSYFNISNRVDGEPRAIKIHDEIGGWGLWAQEFMAELNEIEDSEIEIDIFSPGGSIAHGLQMVKAIESHPATFTAKIDSLAGSMATGLASVCDKVVASRFATYWIHRAQGVAMGDADELSNAGEDLAKLEVKLIDIYEAKSGADRDQIAQWMSEDRPWTAEEAKERGFIDEIYDEDSDESTNRITPALIEAVAKISNSTPPQPRGKTTKPKSQATMTPEEIQAMKDENARLKTSEQEAKTQLAAANNTQNAAVEAALKKDRERTSQINELGSKFGFKAEAKKFADEGKSVEEFQAHILNKSPDDWQNSLKVKNPSHQRNQADEDGDGSDPIAKLEKEIENAKTPLDAGRAGKAMLDQIRKK